jgi:hypothetical protein
MRLQFRPPQRKWRLNARIGGKLRLQAQRLGFGDWVVDLRGLELGACHAVRCKPVSWVSADFSGENQDH